MLSVSAEVIGFRSGIDGSEQRAGLCGPVGVREPMPLVVQLVPGSIADLEGTLETGKAHLELIGSPAVWLRPGGRGPGTVFQGYGEVDVLEAIAAAADRYPIDPDRVCLYGGSMGGAGAWYLATHFPDRFSAFAPFAGYNDYRLWSRPGGMTFPLFPWEEPSWRARSGAFLLENLVETPAWMVHGEWDRAVGGGVDVAHARNSAARLTELGITHRYSELPQTGHNATTRAGETTLLGEVLRWLVASRRPTAPTRISFTTYELRHPGAHWITIQQLAEYGAAPAKVRATATPAEVTLETENLRHAAIGPVPSAAQSTSLRVDGTKIAGADLRVQCGVRRDASGTWRLADPAPPRDEKRPGVSGPFGDLFRRGTVLVAGTTGTEAERFQIDACIKNAAGFFRQWNGGVHRGGIVGENWVDLPVISDVDYLAGGDDPRNVILYGTPATNAALAGLAGRLGLEFGQDRIRLREREWKGENVAIIAVLPHPDGGDRYVAVHGGVSADAITFGAHLHWQLLPDFLVYDRDRAVEWGFFGNGWS